MVGFALLAATDRAESQNGNARLRGLIADSATARPLAGVLVDVGGDSLKRSVRTDAHGAFEVVLPRGEYALSARQPGYQPRSMRLRIADRDTNVFIALAPNPVALPRLRVYATGPELFGAVAAYAGLKPVSEARVQVIGAGKSTTTDSLGRFEVKLPKPGTYIVRTGKAGYADHLATIEVPDSAVELVVLLDSSSAGPIPAALAQEFDERVRWQGQGAALVRGEDLRRYGGTTEQALAASTAAIRRGLHFGPQVCLFVNGVPRPHLPVDAIVVEEIETVELYTVRGEVTNTLQQAWPPGTSCDDGSPKPLPTIASGSDAGIIRYVVIWLRR